MKPPLPADAFVLGLLDQSQAFVGGLPSGAYAQRVEALEGSIGGHLRHCLEHVDEWLRGLDRGQLCFEDRRRDPRVQGDADAALAEIARLRSALTLAAARGGHRDRPLTARSSLSGRVDEALACPSTAERELIYVGLHFVHHLALMAVAARLQGLPVPPGLGKAPATLEYERGLAC